VCVSSSFPHYIPSNIPSHLASQQIFAMQTRSPWTTENLLPALLPLSLRANSTRSPGARCRIRLGTTKRRQHGRGGGPHAVLEPPGRQLLGYAFRRRRDQRCPVDRVEGDESTAGAGLAVYLRGAGRGGGDGEGRGEAEERGCGAGDGEGGEGSHG
jgi:hypothetical protein